MTSLQQMSASMCLRTTEEWNLAAGDGTFRYLLTPTKTTAPQSYTELLHQVAKLGDPEIILFKDKLLDFIFHSRLHFIILSCSGMGCLWNFPAHEQKHGIQFATNISFNVCKSNLTTMKLPPASLHVMKLTCRIQAVEWTLVLEAKIVTTSL